jgi:hypothetical protein
LFNPKQLVIPPEIVKKMVFTFPTGSSPGPMGLRAEHLRLGFRFHLQTNLLETLTRLVNLLITGKVLNSISPFLAGATLSALEKKGGGVRPLACGNLLRRLTSKCICNVTKDRFKAHLSPHQVGVAVPGGAEIIVHEARNLAQRFSDPSFSEYGFLKVDFRNAFNEVNRQVIYDELVEYFPEIVPYFSWCYANPSTLFYGDFKLSSESGVQQGDPLGPFLFSLALRKLILKISEVHQPHLVLNRWYLDDGNIAGKFSILSNVLEQIDEHGPPLGLLLNRSKCQVYGFKTAPPPPLFPKLEELGQSNFDTLGSPSSLFKICIGQATKDL